MKYDAKNVVITITPKNTKHKKFNWTGFAPGTMVEFGQDSDDVQRFVDAQGNGDFAVQNDKSGHVNIHGSQLTGSNKKIAALRGEEFAIVVETPEEKISASNAMFTKMPDGSLGNDLTPRDWNMLCTDFKHEFK
ncbi:hypothetical protein EQG49_12825 [Periweissella cryptocerci]|uniref:Uncharacterized protein n=1 Tax=Periweissella cryptocerci TaxID=2506420 RepID=A0A4P6YWQ8_9LACO|nr:hypothetical protein [Periweissella cryptocerci]QBO37280.1 hypothetical protein EQG49_12825 [Periweissella cryptocerci]